VTDVPLPAGRMWRTRPGLADEELDGERVIWDPVTGHLARLDRIGSLVWASLDGTVTIEELASELSAAFGAVHADVCADVEDLVRQLSAMGLLVEDSGEPAEP